MPDLTPEPLPRRCPVCDGQETAAIGTKGSLVLVRCRHCAMVFASHLPADLASGAFYEELSQPYYLSREKLDSDYASVRFERELRLFRAFCPAGRVLDVGCSTGAFLYQLQQRWPGAYQAMGTDVAAGALEYAASRGMRVVRSSLLEADLGEASLDAVCFWAVLEHVAEPRRFLDRAASLLRPGGHAFMLVPNFNSLAVRVLGLRYRYVMAEHLNYFTRATLQALVARESRLAVVRAACTHFNPVVIWQDLRQPRERVPDTERANLLARTTAWKQNRWLRPARLLYAAAERVLGGLGLADNLVLVVRKRPTEA